MSKSFALFFMVLIVTRCSAVTVGKCDSSVKDFLSKSPHRAIVMHPQGCYMSWDESPSPLEAERRALLFCSKANPDSDNSCTVVATDNSICPLSLKNWVQERRETDKVPEEILKERQCQFGSAFEVKSAPGTKPPPVGTGADALLIRALAALGLNDYEPESRVQIVFGRSPASKSNWIVTEALDFVKPKSGKKTCALRVSSGWDPRLKYFDTVFRVQLIGCFEADGNSG
jgi:hypothetical protein